MSEVLIHQFDPILPAIGGVDGYIADVISNAPTGVEFRILGVASPRSGVRLGVWEEVALGSVRVPFMAVAHLDRRDRRALPHSARLIRGLARYRPSLEGARIHAHRCDVGLAASLLYPTTPVVQFIHEDSNEALAGRHESYWRLFPPGYRLIERLAITRAQHAVVMNYDASVRLGQISQHVTYGRNWFDGSIFHPDGNGSPSGCFGWVGRLEEAKDPALAVATFSEIKKLGGPFRGWLAGSGSLLPSLRDQVARDGLTENVELLGELTAEELAGRLARTSVLLITSHSEGLPRAALEALGCGTPVVSTRCGDLTRLITDRNGCLVGSREPRELAEAIWRVEESVSRSEATTSVEDYRMQVVLDELFRSLQLLPPSKRTARPQPHRLRIAVVSYHARDSFQPRGARTHALVKELERDHSVELIAADRAQRGAKQNRRLGSSRARRLAGGMIRSVLVDEFEGWSTRQFRNWRPDADGVILIGFPFSPILHASARLRRLGTPYVVDIGDPLALTARQPAMRGLALHRARRAEARMWPHAAAAVVTTQLQADALHALYPGLPILVRPNGVEASDVGAPSPNGPRGRGDTLALVHFGRVYASRLDIRPFVRRLVEDGPWERLQLTQFGPDWTGGLADLGPAVDVLVRDPVSWPEALRCAQDFDAALVIGNVDPSQLPSKVTAYLTLPIPRIAITREPERDAIGTYLRGKNGWLVLQPDTPDAPELIRLHVSRDWSPAQLAAPASESWPVVAKDIADFAVEALRGMSTA